VAAPHRCLTLYSTVQYAQGRGLKGRMLFLFRSTALLGKFGLAARAAD
jgi:hypothetical protein